MTFDSNKPDGGLPIAQGDDDIRTNQDAVLTALGQEHQFVDADAANQSGRHSFPIDTTAGLNNPVDGVSPIEGSIGFSTDNRVVPPAVVFVVYQAGAWVAADVNPLDSGLSPTLPRVNEQVPFEKSQVAPWESRAVIAGNHTPNYGDSALSFMTLNQDLTFVNPLTANAGEGTIIYYDLRVSGGPFTVSWGSAYRAQDGLIQIALGDTQRTMLSFMLDPDGNTIVTSLPNYNTGALVTVGQV